MYRISDNMISRVEAAIRELEVLQVIRDGIGYEVTPAFLLGGPAGLILSYMIAISLPVPGPEGDHVLYALPVDDSHAPQEAVSQAVRQLYRQAQDEADATRTRRAVAGNGHEGA